MTARALFLGSTINLAVKLTFLHVNTTAVFRAGRSSLHRPRSVGEAEADRSCRISRQSIESITVVPVLRALLCHAPDQDLQRKRQILLKIES